MKVDIGNLHANEVNFVEGTLNKWASAKMKPSSEELSKIIEIIRKMKEKIEQLEFNPVSHDQAVKLLEDTENSLSEEPSDPKTVQANLQEVTKIVTEGLISEIENIGLDPKIERKIKNSLETALIELEEDKPKPMTVEDGLKKASNILKETEGIMDKVKKLVPYAELIGLWLGKTVQQLGWF